MEIARRYPYLKLDTTKGGQRLLEKGDAMQCVLHTRKKGYKTERGWSASLDKASVKKMTEWFEFCKNEDLNEGIICSIKY